MDLDLKSYLEQTDERQHEFAARVGTTAATISRIIKHDFKVGHELALRIEKATLGVVDAGSLSDSVKAVRKAAA